MLWRKQIANHCVNAVSGTVTLLNLYLSAVTQSTHTSGYSSVSLWWCSNHQYLKWVKRSSGHDPLPKKAVLTFQRVLWTPKPCKSYPPHLENRQDRIKTCYFKQWKTQKAKNKDCIPMFLSLRQVRFPQIWREWQSNTKCRGLLF